MTVTFSQAQKPKSHFKVLSDILCKTFEKVPSDDRDLLWYTNLLDLFMYRYLMHICIEPTQKIRRRRFLGELRDLMKESHFEEYHIWTLISGMESYMLENELYEYLALNLENKKLVKRIIDKAKRD